MTRTPSYNEIDRRADRLMADPHWIREALHEILDAGGAVWDAFRHAVLALTLDPYNHAAHERAQDILRYRAYVRAYKDIMREASCAA